MKDIGPIFRSLLRNKLGVTLIALQIALTMAIVTNAAFIIGERSADIARPSGLDEANTALFITNLFDSNVDQQQLLHFVGTYYCRMWKFLDWHDAQFFLNRLYENHRS